jgi:hypothetical protein
MMSTTTAILAAVMLPRWLTAWLAAFVATQVFESPIHAVALSWAWRGDTTHADSLPSAATTAAGGSRWWRPTPRVWFTALIPSSLTHPVVWFVFPRLFPLDWFTMVVAAETFAVLGEALILRGLAPRLGFIGALCVSVVANATSLGLGLWLRSTTGWV